MSPEITFAILVYLFFVQFCSGVFRWFDRQINPPAVPHDEVARLWNVMNHLGKSVEKLEQTNSINPSAVTDLKNDVDKIKLAIGLREFKKGA